MLAMPVSSLGAEELALRADALRELDPHSIVVLNEARALYEKALRRNPRLAAALMGDANALAQLLERGSSASQTGLLREYDEMSMRLLAVVQREARAWNIRADALHRQEQWNAALEANTRAQTLDPTRASTWGQRAHLLVDMGQPDAALSAIHRGLSLEPPVPVIGYLLSAECRAHLALGVMFQEVVHLSVI